MADYAGALVLEVPTVATTTVTAYPANELVVGEVRLARAAIGDLADRPDHEVRVALDGCPPWSRYLVSVVVVLVRAGVVDPPAVELRVESDVPIAQGVSSSAALEVATARALGADDAVEPLELARLCQAAENGIVGAPCGIMDQVAVVLGRPGAVLPIRCRPAAVGEPVPLPRGTEVVGWPSGVAHDVGGDAYRRARVASFMGRRIAEAATGRSVRWTSELQPACIPDLPEVLDGASFLDRWKGTSDPLTTVDPDGEYPVRAATAFGIEEHRRATAALARLRAGDAAGLAGAMAASHAGYRAMGLGHRRTDEIVAAALDRPGVHGARSSGGGAGGTVVVLCDRGALADVDEPLIR